MANGKPRHFEHGIHLASRCRHKPQSSPKTGKPASTKAACELSINPWNEPMGTRHIGPVIIAESSPASSAPRGQRARKIASQSRQGRKIPRSNSAAASLRDRPQPKRGIHRVAQPLIDSAGHQNVLIANLKCNRPNAAKIAMRPVKQSHRRDQHERAEPSLHRIKGVSGELWLAREHKNQRNRNIPLKANAISKFSRKRTRVARPASCGRGADADSG